MTHDECVANLSQVRGILETMHTVRVDSDHTPHHANLLEDALRVHIGNLIQAVQMASRIVEAAANTA